MSRVRTIRRLIADAQQRLRKVNSDAEKIRAEIAELERRLSDAEQLALPLEQRRRGLSDKWGTILNYLVLRAPNPVTVDEILVFATENDLGVTRAAIRAQLHNYEKRGFVTRC
jgi:hypothetical protein